MWKSHTLLSITRGYTFYYDILSASANGTFGAATIAASATPEPLALPGSRAFDPHWLQPEVSRNLRETADEVPASDCKKHTRTLLSASFQ
jgi:hypothetical protein